MLIMPSYEQNKESKLWSVRFRVMENGVRHQKRLSGYKLKKDAAEGYRAYMNEYDTAKTALIDDASPEKILFSDLCDAYLAAKKDSMKESSYYDTFGRIDKRIKPFFEGKYVEDIKPKDVLEWQKTVSDYSYKYKSKLLSLIKSVLRFGYKYYDTENISDKIEPFRNLEPEKEMLFWTKEEFKKFIAIVDDERYNIFFRTLYIAGCRKGEALALTWKDIDTSAGVIKLTKNITRKTSEGPWKVTTPKNKPSYRTVDIPPNLCHRFDQYREWQKENCDSTDFVFCGNRPFPEMSLTRIFYDYTDKAGVKRIRIHDLRHSCASLLISEGVSIVAVSKRLGHKDVKQTLNTYSHLMPSDSSKILQIFDDI